MPRGTKGSLETSLDIQEMDALEESIVDFDEDGITRGIE